MTGLQEALGGRYRLSHEIGHGGMATVYLAEDTKSGQRVAVKVLRQELTAILGATRFHREIEILSRLEHPNIVPVLDSRKAGSRLYYVMPFVSGDSVRDRLERQGPLRWDDVIRIAGDVAGAIDYAHGQGVLHRDIKPENMLLEGNRALVCDFGVARAIETAGREFSSSSGLVVGTPMYMSPEQAVGDPVDRQSDIYALGCVVYEMLAGEPPFAGPTAQAGTRTEAQRAAAQLRTRTTGDSTGRGAERFCRHWRRTRPIDRPAPDSWFAQLMVEAGQRLEHDVE